MRLSRCFCILSFYLLLGRLAGQSYIWPTDAGQILTSTFAEARNGRFHAGIDVKTWGQTGFPVFAIRDGYVSRIRISPFGYGRALYLTLDTGEVVVYAHLERFSDEIQHYVKEEQERRESYEIQVYPAESQFSFKQGEIVGYSGQSGVGYPHLHFEMRDSGNNPINPLAKGYQLKDSIAPMVSKVLLQPMDALSAVNQDFEPVIITPVYEGNGRYRVAPVLAVSGRVGFGISAFDQMEGADNRFGIYRNEFYLNDQLVFSSQYDRYSYDENRQFKLDRNYRQMMRGNGYFYNLYRDVGNSLPFYDRTDDYYGVIDFIKEFSLENAYFLQGKIVNPPQTVTKVWGREHQYRLVCYDYWGNAAEVRGRLQVDGEHLILPPIEQEESDTLFQPNWVEAWNDGESDRPQEKKYYRVSSQYYDDYIRLSFLAQEAGLEPPRVSGRLCDKEEFVLPLLRIGENEFVGAWPLAECSSVPLELTIESITRSGQVRRQKESFGFAVIARGKSQIFVTDEGLSRIEFSPRSLYKTLFLRHQIEPASVGGAPQTVGGCYRFEPADVPLNAGARLTLSYPADEESPAKLAIYQKYGDQFQFLDNILNGQQRTISSQISGMGEFVLLRDGTAPQITALVPYDQSTLRNTKPRLSASFYDELSGIGGENSRVLQLDGRKVIAEYDYEKPELFYQLEESLSVGKHIIEVIVRDRSGNVSSQRHTFFIQ
ncbi:MAG: M23 family metallopeptidase [Calditrichaeota bacterium]|nr:MAG: M23 family metallopeptidase [Calditrichota bacterium]